MTKLQNKKDVGVFTLLCSVIYFMSYVSRINLSAVFVAVTESGYAPKDAVALALTVCSVTYGAGQLISGFLGDKFKPHNLIFTGFIITAVMNMAVGTIGGNSVVLLWAVNGFAQSLMWPPLVKIMSDKLCEDDYKKAVVKVSWGSSCGTIAVYLLSPFIIKALSVKFVFIISSVLAIIMSVVVKAVFDKNELFRVESIIKSVNKNDSEAGESKGFSKSAVILLSLIMFAILCQGALRDGVTNWTPTYISEIFNLDSSLSILTSVILPIFSVLSFTFVSFINRKFVKNELVCAGVVFAIGAVSGALLLVLGGKSVAVALVLLALLVGSMHGVNLILVCMTPAFFAKYGKVSFVSGLINSSTYVGAAISTYGIALFTESFGWDKTVGLWVGIAFVGTMICLCVSKAWTAFKKR